MIDAAAKLICQSVTQSFIHSFIQANRSPPLASSTFYDNKKHCSHSHREIFLSSVLLYLYIFYVDTVNHRTMESNKIWRKTNLLLQFHSNRILFSAASSNSNSTHPLLVGRGAVDPVQLKQSICIVVNIYNVISLTVNCHV